MFALSCEHVGCWHLHFDDDEMLTQICYVQASKICGHYWMKLLEWRNYIALAWLHWAHCKAATLPTLTNLVSIISIEMLFIVSNKIHTKSVHLKKIWNQLHLYVYNIVYFLIIMNDCS